MKKFTLIVVGLGIALALAVILSPFASSSPDGLERVGEDHGFMEKAVAFFKGLLPDYIVPGIGNEKIATALAGAIGVLIVFIITILLALMIRRKKNKAGG